MDPAERDEINRIWAELKTLNALVAWDIGRRWGAARVAAWHERQIFHAEADGDVTPEIAANMVRALDKLGARLNAVTLTPPPVP